MRTGDAVREVMKINQTSVTHLVSQLGKSPRLVSERLGQENISAKKVNEMLQVMGYKTIIVPKNTKIPSDSFEIE